MFAVFVVLLMTGSVAFGQDKRRTEKFSIPLAFTGVSVGVCVGFEVLSDWTSLYTGTLLYDKSGQFVQQVDHVRVIGESRYYNSTDPAKEVMGGPGEMVQGRLDAATGLYYLSGDPYKVRVPGYGLIWSETGLVVYDTNTGQYTFNTGHNQFVDQDLTALCDYLK